jgi:hypothetical protein
LDVCESKRLLFISAIALFFLPIFLGEPWLGRVSFARVAYRQSGRGEGPYLAGGVGYPRLVLLRPLATRFPRESTRSLGRGILSTFLTNFCEKRGHFGGGGECPP